MTKLFYDYQITDAKYQIWDWNLNIVNDKTIGVDVYMTDDTTIFVPVEAFRSNMIEIEDIAKALLELGLIKPI